MFLVLMVMKIHLCENTLYYLTGELIPSNYISLHYVHDVHPSHQDDSPGRQAWKQWNI